MKALVRLLFISVISIILAGAGCAEEKTPENTECEDDQKEEETEKPEENKKPAEYVELVLPIPDIEKDGGKAAIEYLNKKSDHYTEHVNATHDFEKYTEEELQVILKHLDKTREKQYADWIQEANFAMPLEVTAKAQEVLSNPSKELSSCKPDYGMGRGIACSFVATLGRKLNPNPYADQLKIRVTCIDGDGVTVEQSEFSKLELEWDEDTTPGEKIRLTPENLYMCWYDGGRKLKVDIIPSRGY